MSNEGVIQFEARHDQRELDVRRCGGPACELIAWREIMALTGLVGQEAGRYEGAGYGNVSCRLGPRNAAIGRRAFLITGSQTSGKRCLVLADFAVVDGYDYDRNVVRSHGRTLPSSESMTHAAAYDASPLVRCVLHAHSPVLWRRRKLLRLPETDPAIPYGTPAMAREVSRLYRESVLPERRIMAMGGHEDGILVLGRDPTDAGGVLLRWLARAYGEQCGEGAAGLCAGP
ncbi:MAG: class II aldolase/adducin family protein [Candidatus Palauibacterales bacterium]|jgi:Class II Aldolase and Adducin N-terminal domain|nr:class II aldolase/adducin family protein [Candidatus Palauibacterales bacterium]MDP2483149.1 class II aldolase/adducin family protein [Candidatus Palauibacterales bacterium]